jgi:diguanylate cyclase (GGDEF)-like protein
VDVSFRGRLTLFFVLIVLLPMVAVGVLVVDVTDSARSGKADARLSQGITTASSVYKRQAMRAEGLARRVGSNPELGDALASGDQAAIARELRILGRQYHAASLIVTAPSGRTVATYGEDPPVAGSEVELTGARDFGTLLASKVTAEEYLNLVEGLTGRDGAIFDGHQLVAATAKPDTGSEIPAGNESGAVDVNGDEVRAASVDLPPPGNLLLTLFGPIESGGFLSSSPMVAAALALFFAVALLFVVMLLRTLQDQVATMLGAARRIGGGDFTKKVPVIGRDEMAGLADEFNKMSDRLAEQVDQLRRQQIEIDRSVRRIGEAFASGLDREASLEVLADTALSACEAEYALISVSGREGAEAEVGTFTDDMRDAILRAESRAERAGELSEEAANGTYALGAPLRRIGEPERTIGVMTVARRGREFQAAERDVFLYLIGQAAASIENVALHELVSEQAVTDDLTGLANKRAFDDQAEKEASRAGRFGHALSLLMLDIDDFKQVNDTYGHLQGDQVLRGIGRILDAESRGVDEPARYGGEEFVVALPETDLPGAVELAERIRARIEATEIPWVDDARAVGARERGQPLHVTASIGVATIPDSADDVEALIAAADSALYAAKGAGKNRVASAPERTQREPREAAAGTP